MYTILAHKHEIWYFSIGLFLKLQPIWTLPRYLKPKVGAYMHIFIPFGAVFIVITEINFLLRETLISWKKDLQFKSVSVQHHGRINH